MGGGTWDPGTYQAQTVSSIQAGTNFGYSSQMHSTPHQLRKVHELLDPLYKAGDTSPLAGQVVRESRDSDEHPLSVPISVIFDETGSMGYAPRVIQEKLAGLFGLLLRKGYVEDPQIMVGAYGDAHNNERAPVQISHFESDNRIDESLDKIFLEGNGGGNGGETGALMWYYLAYHTATDAWEKRQKKGYAFFIGDEIAHRVTGSDVATYFDDLEPLGPLDHESIVAKLLEKWDAYVLIENNLSAEMQGSVEFYTKLFGKDRVIIMEDLQNVAETIGLIIGMNEGTIDLDDGVEDLKELGFEEDDIRKTKKALATYGGRSLGQLVTSGAPGDLDDDSDDAVDRV
jgi:hypothetical protein